MMMMINLNVRAYSSFQNKTKENKKLFEFNITIEGRTRIVQFQSDVNNRQYADRVGFSFPFFSRFDMKSSIYIPGCTLYNRWI